MATSKVAPTEARYKKWRKEKRGQGEGSFYRPWLTVRDVPSNGRVHRVMGAKSGREHQFLSDIEEAACLDADWHVEVIDIREQFPLDRDETRNIAAAMGVRHPYANGIDVVMTTDMLLSVRSARTGGVRFEAVCVKPSDMLDDKRVLEKLEIERRYWVGQAAGFTIFTEKQVSKHRVRTLQRLMSARRLDVLAEGKPFWLEAARLVLQALLQGGDSTVAEFGSKLDLDYGWGPGSALFAISHLASVRALTIDLDNYDTQGSLEQLVLPSSPVLLGVAA